MQIPRSLPAAARAPATLPAALGAAAVAGLASASGGFFPVSWGWAALGLLWAATLALLLRGEVRLGRADLAFVAALAALTGWTALSAVWSASPPSSLLETQRGLVYLAGVAAALACCERRSAPALLAGVLAAVTGVAVYNLARRAGGGLEGLGATAVPIGYANALGILDALAALLALGFAARARGRGGRLVAGAPLAVLLPDLWLTGSRGAIAAMLAGLVVAATLARPSRRAAAAGALAVVAVLLGVALVAFRGNERPKYWRAAWAEVESAPALGTGAGTYVLSWRLHRSEALDTQDAHNLYLETLAELGPPGLLLLAAALAVPLGAAVRARRAPLVPATAGAYVAFLVHAGVDFDWEMASVTLAGLLCGAALVLSARPARARRLPRSARAAGIAAALGLAAFAFVGLVGSSAVAASADALRAGDPARAQALARRAARWTPWASAPWARLGLAQLAGGDRTAAAASFRQALAKDPEDADLWRDLALALRGAGRRDALARAARLDPIGAASPG